MTKDGKEKAEYRKIFEACKKRRYDQDGIFGMGVIRDPKDDHEVMIVGNGEISVFYDYDHRQIADLTNAIRDRIRETWPDYKYDIGRLRTIISTEIARHKDKYRADH